MSADPDPREAGEAQSNRSRPNQVGSSPALAGTSDDGLRSTVARGASATALAFALTQALLFLIYVVLARLTTPDVFGTYAAGFVLFGISELLVASGMEAALIQRRQRVEEAAATAFLSTSVAGIIYASLAVALSPVVGLVFDSREIGLVSAAISATLVLSGVSGVPGAMLQRRISALRWGVVEPAAVAALGIGSAAGLLAGFGVWGLVLGWYSCCLTRAVAVWIVVRWRPQLRLATWSMWKELARYARHILASEIIQNAMHIGSTVAIGRWLGTASLGEFRFGWRLVTQVTAPLLMASAFTLQPALVRLYDDRSRSRAAVLSSLRIVSLVAFPISASFVPFGEAYALLVFGSDWRGAGTVMTALAPMAMGLAMESVPKEVLKARGRPDVLPWVHGLWAVLCLGLIVLLVRFGAVGVGVAWSVSTSVVALTALLRLGPVLQISPRLVARAIVPAGVSATAVAGGLVLIQYVIGWNPDANLATAGWLLVQILAGATAYAVAMAVVDWEAVREFVETVRLLLMRRRRVA